MAPIAYALLEEIMIPKMKEENDKAIEVLDAEVEKEEVVRKLDTKRLSIRDRGKCAPLTIAWREFECLKGSASV